MAEIHLLQWTAAFIGALYITFQWLVTRPRSRWRHITVGIVSTLLWIPVAYTAGNVGVATDSGEVVTFGSEALGGVAIFMVVVCIGGLVLGLLLWVEEEAEEAHKELPSEMQHRPRRGD